MDTFSLIPEKASFVVQVQHENGGKVYHRFATQAEALAWIVDRKRIETAKRPPPLPVNDNPTPAPGN